MNRKFLSSPLILILPSIFAIGILIIIPLIFSFYTRFTSYKLTRTDSFYNFVGLSNYERLIDNSSSEPFAEFFKQFVKNEEQLDLLYKKYLTRVPELDALKY